MEEDRDESNDDADNESVPDGDKQYMKGIHWPKDNCLCWFLLSFYDIVVLKQLFLTCFYGLIC